MSGSHTYKFDVTMTCGGCSGAVDRVLKRLKENESNIVSYTVLLDEKSANVTVDDESPALYEKILRTIKKTGKGVNSCVELDSNGNKIRDVDVVLKDE
ncbi:hypothetical protein QR685DRAFT_523368 [Neurospora intermedia]|uniref:HMA domain-containing protein n=1 Tax=Neurospora intermedia TaxID=5142 RepID=A0ABR3DEK0_NEUIN